MTGASRSRAPRSASIITAVAVTIFVIENHRNVVLGGDRPEGADIGQATGDELHRTVSGHHGGGQAGRSPARRGVLDERLRAVRRGGAAAPGH